MEGLQAIETLYKECRFRSRLEARWAVYFDAIGIQWEYEKEGYNLPGVGNYVPDFWLPQVNKWAEVKPTQFSELESGKANALVLATGFECLKLIGPPAAISYGYFGADADAYDGMNDYVLTGDYISDGRLFNFAGYGPGTDVSDWKSIASAVDKAKNYRFWDPK